MNAPRRVTVIDMGSNAIRMMIAEECDNHTYQHIFKVRKPIRLGADVFTKGFVDSQLLRETTAAFREFKEISKDNHCGAFLAIATSALRNAKNNTDVIQQVFNETGIKIELISGTKEADLVFQAINEKLNLNKKNALLIDIGGGSVELVSTKKGNIKSSQSFPLGTVRLLEKLKSAEQQKQQEAYHFIESEIFEIKKWIQDHKIDYNYLIGIGGNFERMLKIQNLVQKDQTSLKELSLIQIKQIFDLALSMSNEERQLKLNLKPDQTDVIIPALIITLVCMEQAGVQRLKIPKVGIKDSLIANHFRKT